MLVIKKSDQQENFSLDKFFQSINAARLNTEEPLDIELLMAEFQNIVVDKDFITTGQINVIACGLLYTKGFMKTLKNYFEFTKQQ